MCENYYYNINVKRYILCIYKYTYLYIKKDVLVLQININEKLKNVLFVPIKIYLKGYQSPPLPEIFYFRSLHLI